jgi:LysM repeat protein
MAHQETALRTAAELGAWSVATVGAVVLLLALVAELHRRAGRTSALTGLVDRLLPTPSRRVVAALVTVVSAVTALSLPAAARADDHHTRSWLEDDGTTTTTTSTGVPRRAPSTTTVPSRARAHHRREPVTSSSTTIATSPSSTTSTSSSASTSTTTTSTTIPVASPTSGPVGPVRPGAVLRAAPPSTPSPAPAAPPAVPVPATTDAALTTYTVVNGDCLWSIAALRLGRAATGRAIDRGWRAIYAANHDAIGSDPNLIHPGLVLTLPPLDPTP